MRCRFHCHAAWEELQVTETVYVLGNCGNDEKVFEVHIAKTESPELAEDDESLTNPAEGDADAEFAPCMGVTKDLHGNPAPQTEFEKFSCRYELLDMWEVAEHEEDLASPQKLVSKVNGKSLSWRARHYKEFGTMTKKQFAKTKLGVKFPTTEELAKVPKVAMQALDGGLPEEYDFREKFPYCLANRIRNQGLCGSCYAFAATKAYDLALCQKSDGHFNVEVSTQQAVSCYNEDGCNGGWAGPVWDDMINKTHGFHTRRCLPYEGKDANDEGGIVCETEDLCTNDMTYFAHSYHLVQPTAGLDAEEAIKAALVEYGPLWVAFPVCASFMSYQDGIYEPIEGPECKEGQPGAPVGYHAVALIGYTKNAWVLANSWGKGWGEDGFFKSARGEKNIVFYDFVLAVSPEPRQEMTCAHSPTCQNGGAFTNDCTCECPPGFAGATCEMCQGQCYNGGMWNEYDCFCWCPEGTWGDSCEYKFTMQWKDFDQQSMKASFHVEWSFKELHPTNDAYANAILRFWDDSFGTICGNEEQHICGKHPVETATGMMDIEGIELQWQLGHPYQVCYGMYVFLGENEFGFSKGFEKLTYPACMGLEHNDHYPDNGNFCLLGGEPIYDTANPLFHLQCHTEPPPNPESQCINTYGDDWMCDYWVQWGDCDNEWEEWMYHYCAASCAFDCWKPFGQHRTNSGSGEVGPVGGSGSGYGSSYGSGSTGGGEEDWGGSGWGSSSTGYGSATGSG